MRRNRGRVGLSSRLGGMLLAVALVGAICALPQSAIADTGQPTISTSPALARATHLSGFVVQVRHSRYVTDGDAAVSVTAPAGTTVSVDGATPRTGTFSASVSRAWGQGFAFSVFTGSSPVTYHVRCLPTDFPAFAVNHSGTTQAEYYIVALSSSSTGTFSYIAIIDTNGVPVWWYRPALRATYADLLPSGNMAWAMFAPGGTDVRSLTGSLVANLNSPDNPPSDPHEAQLLPNGNYMLVVYPTVSNVDCRRWRR